MIAYLLLLLVGIGSTMFHMTLQYSMQVLSLSFSLCLHVCLSLSFIYLFAVAVGQHMTLQYSLQVLILPIFFFYFFEFLSYLLNTSRSFWLSACKGMYG